MAAYVAGNGRSRRDIPLDKVKEKGMLYGCNAIYKEITPDVLVSTDKEPAHHIQVSGYAHHNVFYTRKPYSNYGARELQARYSTWSSGPNAVQLAIADKHKEIYLFGFDFGCAKNTYNNIYAGHEFYQNHGSSPTFGGNWITQIKALISQHKNVEFVIVVGDDTADISVLTQFKNVKTMDSSEFLKHINNV